MKKVIPQKTYKMTDPVFLANVHLIVGGTSKDLTKRYKGADDFLEQPAAGKTFQAEDVDKDGKKSRQVFVVWLESASNVELMVHEIIHLVSAIFYDRGVEFHLKESEAFAYTTGYWVDQFLTKLKPKKK